MRGIAVYTAGVNTQAFSFNGSTPAPYGGPSGSFTASRAAIGMDGNGVHQWGGFIRQLAGWACRVPPARLLPQLTAGTLAP